MATKTSSIVQIAQLLPQTKGEKIADGVAVASATSHFWLPALRETSEYAGYLLPILGCAFILVRMGLLLYDRCRGRSRSVD